MFVSLTTCSSTRSKKVGESASPCLRPVVTLNGCDLVLKIISTSELISYFHVEKGDQI